MYIHINSPHKIDISSSTSTAHYLIQQKREQFDNAPDGRSSGESPKEGVVCTTSSLASTLSHMNATGTCVGVFDTVNEAR
jgi:hypothetical protein